MILSWYSLQRRPDLAIAADFHGGGSMPRNGQLLPGTLFGDRWCDYTLRFRPVNNREELPAFLILTDKPPSITN
jgi:hypothetical protein